MRTRIGSVGVMAKPPPTRTSAAEPSARMRAARARAAEPWSLYLLQCKGGAIYTGIARDVAARYAAHLNGTGARYTRSRPPRLLLMEIVYPNQRDASRAEYAVKRLTALQKRALIRRLRLLPLEQRADALQSACGLDAGRFADLRRPRPPGQR